MAEVKLLVNRTVQ